MGISNHVVQQTDLDGCMPPGELLLLAVVWCGYIEVPPTSYLNRALLLHRGSFSSDGSRRDLIAKACDTAAWSSGALQVLPDQADLLLISARGLEPPDYM